MSSNKKQKVSSEYEKNIQQCTKALKLIMKNPAAGAFLTPVDWKALYARAGRSKCLAVPA